MGHASLRNWSWVALSACLVTLLPTSRACLGAPYLYITFHGGGARNDINTVLR